jgi:hypothetical protein
MTAQEHWAGDYDAPLAPALVVAGIKPLDNERDMWTSYAAVRRRRSRRLLRAGLAVVRPAPLICYLLLPVCPSAALWPGRAGRHSCDRERTSLGVRRPHARAARGCRGHAPC